MAEAAAAAATPLLGKLPDEIVLWEILAHLDPKSLLRCRAVRAPGAVPPPPTASSSPTTPASQPSPWSAATNTIPSSPWTTGPPPTPSSRPSPGLTKTWFLRPPATASSSSPRASTRLALAPAASPSATRPRVSMSPSGHCRASGSWGCTHTALLPPRYIGCSGTKLASAFFDVPAKLRGSLNWYPVYYPSASNTLEARTYEADRELVIIFDTKAESFREMRAPVVLTESYIFEMDDTLGIYSCNKVTKIVDIRVLQNYESEVWNLKYRVELPMAEIRGKLQGLDGEGYWYVTVVSGDGDVLLLVRICHSLFYVDTDGKLVVSFQDFYASKRQLKQTLVPHDFFTTPEDFAMDASPFI